MKEEIVFDTTISPTIAGSIDEFNAYVNDFNRKYPFHNKMSLTGSTNVSKANLRKMPCCATVKRNNKMEFHCMDGENGHQRITYSIYEDENSPEKLSDRISFKAINYFNNLAKELTGKTMMEILPVDDPEETVEMFTCPENKFSMYYNYINERMLNRPIKHCYSLDRNNSFIASLKELFPETAPVVDEYYKQRLAFKERCAEFPYDKELKQQYLDFKTLGSVFIGCLKQKRNHRTNVWKKVISDANKKVHELRKYISAQGAIVILVNTDAVKFTTFEPIEYKASTELGGFKYEWQDKIMYVKGVKSYAYWEEDKHKWTIKQAGKTTLDLKKPNREEWTLEEFKDPKNTKVLMVKIMKDGTLEEVEE